MNFAICFLAYGDKYIKEFNIICNNLLNINPNLNIFVCTNNKSKIENKNINIVETNKKFNYNLKKESIKIALKSFDNILWMDTDILIKNTIDFSIFETLTENGLYVYKKPYKIFRHKSKCISIHNILNTTKYGKLIKKFNNNSDLFFLDEHIFIIKECDTLKKQAFIDNWDYIFNNLQNYKLNNNGMYEGLNIYAAAIKANIKIINPNIKLKIFFQSLPHYGWDLQKNKDFFEKKSII